MYMCVPILYDYDLMLVYMYIHDIVYTYDVCACTQYAVHVCIYVECSYIHVYAVGYNQ